MSNSNSSAAIEQNGLLAAVFLRELADLMEKHNATLILERCWDNQYESHAELDFEVGGQFLMGNFHAAPLAKLSALDIRKLSANGG